LIRVRASSLNRADVGVAAGHQHGRQGGIGSRIGLECSGEVTAVGSAVKTFKAGDRVMGAAPGGYAEYVVADVGRIHHIPANNMTYEQAACLPVALQTLHNAIVTVGRFKRGETILIQGASSGVGLMGLQIGKYMGATLVMGTSTNPARRARLKEFGCDLAIDSSAPSWSDDVKKATGGKGVDLIVDMVSAPVANQNLEAAAILGRIVNVGRLGGTKGEFNYDLHALKRIDYIGVTNRTRTPDELNEVTCLMRADLWPAVEAGKLSLPIDRTFRLDQVADALAMMRANQHFGKIVLTM
jgi:NADPH2:quinone reductase